jgi:hypothetical protein
MGQLHCLDDHRRQRRESDLGLTMDDVQGRDYAGLADSLHAVARMREILTRHMPLGVIWQDLLLDLVAALHARHLGDAKDLVPACQALVECIEPILTPANQRELGAALVLMTLLTESGQHSRAGAA